MRKNPTQTFRRPLARLAALFFWAGLALWALPDASAQIKQPGQQPGQGGGVDNPTGRNPFAQDSTQRERKPGQRILDDSTEVVYGPSTTRFVTERDWFLSRDEQHTLDTGLNHFHRYNFVARKDYERLDLGNVGTANQPIFYQTPTHAGTRLGRDALSVYDVEDEAVRYFDTKSPHTDWHYVQGGTQRFWVDVTYSQNITPKMNAGLRYRRVSGPLLTGSQLESRAVREARRQEFGAFYRYESDNGRYRLLANASFFGHDLTETGGLAVPEGVSNLNDLFFLEPRELSNQLENVTGYLSRQRFHAYHEYELIDSTGLHAFHALTTVSQESGFQDPNHDSEQHAALYPEPRFAAERAYHRTRYDLLENKVGVKQRVGDRLFVAGYYKLRQYKFATKYSPDSQIPYEVPAEHFLGGEFSLRVSDSLTLEGSGEFLLYEDFNYRVAVKNRWLEAYFRQAYVSPTLLQRFRYDVFYQWDNDFVNTLTTEVGASLDLSRGEYAIRPFVSVANVNDYVYFDQSAAPRQEGDALQLLRAGFRAEASLGRFHNRTYFVFSERSGPDVMRVPRWLGNSTFYYENQFFKEAILVRGGMDFHYKSAFQANAYMPVTRVFHLQDEYTIGDYLYADAFVSFRILRVRMFFKVADVLRNLFGPGYYMTPRYMGQGRDFEFGLTWQLFD